MKESNEPQSHREITEDTKANTEKKEGRGAGDELLLGESPRFGTATTVAGR